MSDGIDHADYTRAAMEEAAIVADLRRQVEVLEAERDRYQEALERARYRARAHAIRIEGMGVMAGCPSVVNLEKYAEDYDRALNPESDSPQAYSDPDRVCPEVDDA